eukprot:6185639-Pleurochrysis_carterae.AAC.2
MCSRWGRTWRRSQSRPSSRRTTSAKGRAVGAGRELDSVCAAISGEQCFADNGIRGGGLRGECSRS